MKMSESIKNLAVSLVKAQSELEAVAKKSDNPFFKSKYAKLEQIWESVQPTLQRHGLAVSQYPVSDEYGVGCVTMLMHESGEYISQGCTLPISKQDAQKACAGITYCRRYGLSSCLSLMTEDDDDGNKAAGKVDKSEPRLIEVVRSAISKAITLKTFTKGQFAAFLQKEYNAENLDHLTKPQLETILDTINGWGA